MICRQKFGCIICFKLFSKMSYNLKYKCITLFDMLIIYYFDCSKYIIITYYTHYIRGLDIPNIQGNCEFNEV